MFGPNGQADRCPSTAKVAACEGVLSEVKPTKDAREASFKYLSPDINFRNELVHKLFMSASEIPNNSHTEMAELTEGRLICEETVSEGKSTPPPYEANDHLHTNQQALESYNHPSLQFHLENLQQNIRHKHI